MNRTGICFYVDLDTGLPFFIWRDQDKGHPAHQLGAKILVAPRAATVIWARFDPLQLVRRARRMNEAWARGAHEWPQAKNVRPEIRQLILFADWLKREIARNGRGATLPKITITEAA